MSFDPGTLLLYGGFGLIIGSFLNVLILRVGTGSDVGGRSRCMVCQKQLKWYHLIPLFSYLALRGRCGFCGARISLQYPLVEAATGVSFAVVGALGLPMLEQILAFLIAALLVAISAYDIRHTIILDRWAYAFVFLGMLYALAAHMPQFPSDWVVFALSGPLVALPLFAMWLLSRGMWMGLGDAKLALGIGYFLGLYYGVIAIFLAFILGALISVLLLLPLSKWKERATLHSSSAGVSRGGFTMKSEVPFGPFLTCSCFIVFVLQSAGYLVPLALF